MPAQKKDVCKNGHPLNDSTTFINSDGFRRCCECRKKVTADYRKRKRESRKMLDLVLDLTSVSV